MKRRLNYTGRKRISRKRISIILRRNQTDRVIAFSASINLDGLDLPPDAKVYIEAYRRYELKRFEFGTVGNIPISLDVPLADLSSTENLRFRVLVVDAHGKILAHADKIAPEVPADKKPLLEVEFSDLGQRIWLVEFNGTEGGPRLRINSKIPNIENILKNDPRFLMEVYPAVLKEILIRMIFIDGLESIDDPPTQWHKDWLRFSKMLLPESPPREFYRPGDDINLEVKEDWLRWIDNVVDEFCAQRKEWEKYIQIIGGEEKRSS